jgi:NAD(P)-dependent dehydrogenase (short-subunit alcohol dehydrogenase family)
MSSIAAWIGSGDFDDPNFEHRRYNKWRAYGTSKLANAMFIQELSRRLATNNSQAIAVASHPGVSATNLFKHSTLGGWYARRFSQSPERGALPAVFAATAPEATNGSYWGPRGFMEMSGSPAPARIPPQALNPTACRHLWELSEQLTGVRY